MPQVRAAGRWAGSLWVISPDAEGAPATAGSVVVGGTGAEAPGDTSGDGVFGLSVRGLAVGEPGFVGATADEGDDDAEPVGELSGVALEVGDGLEVRDGLGVGVALEVGDGLGEVRMTGGATPGGTVPPPAWSCCQDQPTEPPAGTVSAPTPEEE